MVHELRAPPSTTALAATRDVAAERAAAIDGLLRAVIERAPLVLLLDDLVDPLHQAAVRGLFALDLPILLCLVWGGEGPPPPELEQLALPPLEVDELAQLAATMLPSAWLTPQLATVLASHSGGNPRLATELLRVAAAARLAEGPGAVPDLARLIEEGGAGSMPSPWPSAASPPWRPSKLRLRRSSRSLPTVARGPVWASTPWRRRSMAWLCRG